MKSFARLVKAVTGMSIREFCEKELSVEYASFMWRLKKGRLYPGEVFYIVYKLKTPVKEVFGKSWQELIFTNHSGPLVDKVEKIINKMSADELNEITELIGMHTPKKKDETSSTEPTEEKPNEDPPSSEENALSKIFKKLY